MLRIPLLLALVAIACQAAPKSDASIMNEIYDDVIVGDYEDAVAQTKDLAGRGQNIYITAIVNRLLQNSQRNTIEYAHRLYIRNASNIVKRSFPVQFRLIMEGKPVKLVNKRDNLAMKLGWAIDRDGDATAYGDGIDITSERISWSFSAVAVNNRVFFKLLNIPRNRYLKLANKADGAGDRKAYGSTGADSFRHQWNLHPVISKGELLFYIFNRNFNQALKLGRKVDSARDRQVWGHNGNVIGSPDLFGWHIQPF